jgi:peptide/nickel transport system substrate-binding protein
MLPPLRLAVVLACAASLVLGCRAPGASAPTFRPDEVRRGGVVRVALWQEPLLLNPILGRQTVNALVSRTILEGLLSVGPDGARTPQLALEAPSKENGGLSPDALTVTWKLRPGVVWSDGTPFTSRDVAFTYQVILAPANPVSIRTGYPEIESVSTPDDLTVVVRYRRPYAGFKAHFEWILPEHVFGGDPLIETREFNQAPLGTGPFVFKSWAPGDAITLERNPRFREPAKPYLDGLVFKVVPSRDVAILWLRAGEIDGLWDVSEDDIEVMQAIPDVVVDPAPGRAVERLVLNTSCPSGPQQGDPACPHPVLADVRVRQAIELAIDKKTIVDQLLAGKTRVAGSVIPVGAYATAVPPSEHNPARAVQLLEEAGWRPGPDGIRVKDGTRASLSYATTTGNRLREQTQQLIQEQLRAVGIELRIENLLPPILLGSWQDNAPRARGNFDMLMCTITLGEDPYEGLFNLFHSSSVPTERARGGQNYHRILNPELDQALEAAGSAVDETARKAAFATVAKLVDADKGHILLYQRLDLDPFKSQVKGRGVNIWSDFTWNAQDWWIEK